MARRHEPRLSKPLPLVARTIAAPTACSFPHTASLLPRRSSDIVFALYCRGKAWHRWFRFSFDQLMVRRFPPPGGGSGAVLDLGSVDFESNMFGFGFNFPYGFQVHGPETYWVQFWVSVFTRGCPMEIEIYNFE